MGKCQSKVIDDNKSIKQFTQSTHLNTPQKQFTQSTHLDTPQLKRIIKYTLYSPRTKLACPDNGWIFPCVNCELPTINEVTPDLRTKIACCKTCQIYVEKGGDIVFPHNLSKKIIRIVYE